MANYSPPLPPRRGSPPPEDDRLVEDGIDERTHLLRNSNNDRLSVEEAYQPLWKVYRLLLLCSIAFSLVWILLIFPNTFTHVPFFSSPSAFAFAYTFLALGSVVHAITFFRTPTPRLLAWILPILLVLNLFLCISGTARRELRGVGIVSLVWALIASLLMVGHTIVIHKEDEEEGELVMDSRNWLLRYLSIFGASVVSICLNVIACLVTLNLILLVRDYALSPTPGTLFAVSPSYSVHLYCSDWKSQGASSSPFSSFPDPFGSNSSLPTVLLEAGETPSELGLAQWAEENNDSFRYCLWDRPGYAYSELAPSPHSAGTSADALSSALSLAGERGPWIVVSAGRGGIVSRIFASRNPGLVSGLVLVDALHEDFLARLARPARGFVLFLRAFISPLGLERFGGLIFHRRTGRDRIFGLSSLQAPNSLLAELQESLVADSITKREVATSRIIQRRDVPLAIVSSAEVMKDDDWAARQKDLTTLTDKLLAWQVVDAPHEVWRREEGRRALTSSVNKIIKKIRQEGDV